MMFFLTLKLIHILSVIVLFGLGLGTVFYKIMADRSQNVAAISVTCQHVVLADWYFTTPTVIIQPLTGLLMVSQLDITLTETWLVYTYVLYFLTGVCWLPVVMLQIKMRDIAVLAHSKKEPLPDLYHYYARIWMYLGIPAFFFMITITIFMVFHHHH